MRDQSEGIEHIPHESGAIDRHDERTPQLTVAEHPMRAPGLPVDEVECDVAVIEAAIRHADFLAGRNRLRNVFRSQHVDEVRVSGEKSHRGGGIISRYEPHHPVHVRAAPVVRAVGDQNYSRAAIPLAEAELPAAHWIAGEAAGTTSRCWYGQQVREKYRNRRHLEKRVGLSLLQPQSRGYRIDHRHRIDVV